LLASVTVLKEDWIHRPARRSNPAALGKSFPVSLFGFSHCPFSMPARPVPPARDVDAGGEAEW
jgi:hypothetical protein